MSQDLIDIYRACNGLSLMFCSQSSSSSVSKDDKKFRIYINAQNKDVWKAIEYAESLGLNASSYICDKIIQGWTEDIEIEKDNPDYNYRKKLENEKQSLQLEQQKLLTTLLSNKERTVKNLVSIANEYEERGIEGYDISYIIPMMYSQNLVTKEDMANLILFTVKLYLTLTYTHTNILQSCNSYVQRLVSCIRRDINVNTLIKDFKEEILNKLSLKQTLEEQEKIQKHEQEYKRKKHQEQIKKTKELYKLKQKLEIEQWKLLNPNKELWMKDMTDDEIETSNKIFSGEYTVIDDSELNNNRELETDLSAEHFY